MEKLRLLVIDKDRSVRMLVRMALEGTPHEVVDEADSTQKAVVNIAMARELGTNVILLGKNPIPGQTDDTFTGEVLEIIADAQAVDPDFHPSVMLISGRSSPN